MLPELVSGFVSGLKQGPYLFPALGLSLVVYIVTSYLTSWYRLRHIPGPTLASFSYLWMFKICISGKQAASYKDVNKKYGSNLVRIGPNDLITDDPGVVRRMNSARSPYTRSSWYYAMKMDPYGEGLFSLTDSAAHDRLKAKLSFGYGGKEIPTLEHDINEQLMGLVNLIRKKYISKSDGTITTTHHRPLDLAQAVQFFTLDAITKIAYGKAFGFLETDSDVHQYIQTAQEAIPFLVVLAEMPFLGRVFMAPWMLKLIGPKKTDDKGLGKLLVKAEEVVSKRFGPDAKDQNDMLGAFVRHGVSQRQCEIEVPFQIVAGSDTTATAIRATMLNLASARHAYDRLQKEIDTAVAEGRISSPVTAEEGKQLRYLQAVIYEGLRLQIPFSGLVMKQTPPAGDTIDGKFIPGGTRIAHNTIGMQHNPRIFGEDVDVFRPERWLDAEADPARKQLMVQTTELVFGYGRWGCSGKPVAFLELNKIYVELLRRFDFQIIYPKQPWHEANHNMFFQSQLWVRVTERFPDCVDVETK